jgi:hypothetical protein
VRLGRRTPLHRVLVLMTAPRRLQEATGASDRDTLELCNAVVHLCAQAIRQAGDDEAMAPRLKTEMELHFRRAVCSGLPPGFL